jgi:phosphoglucomutase
MPLVPLKFGTSGWRAVLADEFTFANARRAVAGIASYLKSRGKGGLLLVGYDTRFLAGHFAAEAASLLQMNGFEALVSERPVPTPVLSFEIIRRKALGGLNFTASHNPPKYLGLKFSGSDGAPALPEVTSAIEREIASAGEVAKPEASAAGRFDAAPAYLSALSGLVGAKSFSGLDAALDFRFGTSAGYLDLFLEKAGATVSKIHGNPDPLFGGQSPQCSAKELVELSRLVREKRCRVGLATDGDADRFGILDEKGEYIGPNSILALVAFDLLSRGGARKGIARSVATTHALDAVAKKFGVELFETPVGFKFIGELLLEGKILFGGEESAGLTIEGHVPDKDGILAGLLVARALRDSDKTLSELLAGLEGEIGTYKSARLDLPLAPDALERLSAMRTSPPSKFAGQPVERVDTLDGLKLFLPGGSWVLFRGSGTEPVARFYAEARNEKDLTALLAGGPRFLEG